MDQAKIDAAAAATDVVIEGFNAATRALSTCFTNGAGVLADPNATRSNLADARAAIDRALAAIRDCDWPTNADYDD